LEEISKCFSKNELTLPIMTKCVLKILQNKKFETKRFLKFNGKDRKNGEFNNNENIKTTKILQQKIGKNEYLIKSKAPGASRL